MTEIDVAHSNAQCVAFRKMRLGCNRKVVRLNGSVCITDISGEASTTLWCCADHCFPTIDAGSRKANEECPMVTGRCCLSATESRSEEQEEHSKAGQTTGITHLDCYRDAGSKLPPCPARTSRCSKPPPTTTGLTATAWIMELLISIRCAGASIVLSTSRKTRRLLATHLRTPPPWLIPNSHSGADDCRTTIGKCRVFPILCPANQPSCKSKSNPMTRTRPLKRICIALSMIVTRLSSSIAVGQKQFRACHARNTGF